MLLTRSACVSPHPLTAFDIGSGPPQECVVTVGVEDGMRLQLEDESKTLQSQISLRPDVSPWPHYARWALHQLQPLRGSLGNVILPTHR